MSRKISTVFRVVEEYPQEIVRKVLLVNASSREEARRDPHRYFVKDEGYVIDEGGEALTVACRKLHISQPINSKKGASHGQK